MRTRIEGLNCFSNYDTIQFYLDFPRKKHITSMQMTFGGYISGDLENFMIETRKYNRHIRQIINKRSRDGYFKDKFIYVEGFTDFLKKTGQGGLFHEVFLFLEEEYEKKFVVEYMLDVFDEINQFHREHKFFKFVKYKDRAKIKK